MAGQNFGHTCTHLGAGRSRSLFNGIRLAGSVGRLADRLALEVHTKAALDITQAEHAVSEHTDAKKADEEGHDDFEG